MNPANAYRSLRRRLTETHSVPLFDGANSRRHHRVALWKLSLAAYANRATAGRRFRGVETFVQFAGFPRSGHSLIGSIIDAHPQARVSHELDAMGLLKAGLSQASIFALIDRNSADFTRHGRCWNGFSYLVPDAHHEAGDDLRVIGDKKGDWAVRWIRQQPDLIERLNQDRRTAKKWIVVLRDPFDNIATMSLRKGRAYDDVRMKTSGAQDFRQQLKQHQAEGLIADQALDSEIDEYRSLCETIAKIKAATPADDWFELCHEDLAAEPETLIEQLMTFLDLPAEPAYIASCASLVQRSPNRSRDLLSWPADKHARVASLIRDFSFLHHYDNRDAG